MLRSVIGRRCLHGLPWGVTDLAALVSDRLGLTPDQRRKVEFGAMLHDVGKIAISKEIIQQAKPL